MRHALLPLLLFLIFAASSSAIAAAPNTLTDDELADGWILLFDGETLFGWKAASKADWKVEEGAIRVSSGEKGLLSTTTQFADYVLRVEFRAGKETNSGVFLHTTPSPQNAAADCYELNIAPPDNPFPTGSLVARKKAEGVKPSEDWRAYEVTVNGGHVTVALDGQEVLKYSDPHPLRRGHIGLQLNEGPVAFRNIKLKPLNLKRIFNGKNLDGWNTDGADKSVFSVTQDGEMNVKNGRGYIETEGTWGDFVFQLEVFSNGEGLNSGVFFRSIPGDVMMGYESQIHNGYKNGDRTQPVDAGTGGIFRRQNARRVVADDFEWFHKTIIADGPHMAVWVNGIQVSNWTDSREVDENPRKGLRLKPGTIQIQGHDPTTDLSFRNLAIAETPQRESP